MTGAALALVAAILFFIASATLLRRVHKLHDLAMKYIAEADERNMDALRQKEEALATHLDTRALLEEHAP